ncbi:YeiH family protein [Synechococcus sp. BIOS-E4-1]|uniref:YeiH family protein n=1 Tax=Synechococcus sp. BIOS-E4-1 TaxID=1400864 RepID=UPI00164661CD|nr:putative sulfate exporter family transporter [Synechococcus sp. BIOS-E4-1]
MPDPSIKKSLLSSIFLQPILLSLVAGFLFRNSLDGRSTWIGQSDWLSSRALSFALSLMGAQFVLSDLLAISWHTIVSLLFCIFLTCVVGTVVNRFLKLDNSFMLWLLAGNCICGPAAISFASQIFNGEKKDIAKAIWINTLIGFILMILLPFFADLLNLSSEAFGVWAGSSLQSTAQVVASASIFSTESTDIALMIKSIRIIMLLPVMFLLKILSSPNSIEYSDSKKARKYQFSLNSFLRTFPRFLIVFLMLSFISLMIDLSGILYGPEFSLYTVFSQLRPLLGQVSKFSLSLAMFAIGYLCNFDLSRSDCRAIIFAIFTALQLVFTSYFIIRI